jgi:propanol-preferring alcohol dehydrogenase
MRRMVLRETGPAEDKRLSLNEGDLPAPAPGQVLLRLLANGVCRTDLHIVEGEVATPLPRVPGHQAVGIIDALGGSVDGLSVGQRVGVGWLASTCGACKFCASDRENLCASPRFTGRDVDGGYAEYMVADVRFVFPLPDSFDDIQAAPLLCAGIIGYRSLKLSGIGLGGALGLYGFGASAHIALQVANAWKCKTYVFTREPDHQQHARDLGAVWAGAVEDDPGVPLDAAVSFAPVGTIVPLALQRLDRGGTLAINAIHATDIPSFPYEAIYWERAVRSVANYTRNDALEFLDLAGRIDLRIDTQAYSLDRANDALVDLQRGDVRGAAVLVP